MSINWRNWKALINMNNIEIVFICLCYFAGMGAILFGALSGNEYGIYFVVIGGLTLTLVVYHAANRAWRLCTENLIIKDMK